MSNFELVAAGRSGTYTIDDVQNVTTRRVDPIPAAADDEYTEYTITLKDGTVRVAKVSGMMRWVNVERVFRETGFVGSVKSLLAHQ